MLGYRPEELIGKTISETPVLTPARAALTVSNIGRTLAGEGPSHDGICVHGKGRDRQVRRGGEIRAPLR